MSDRSFAELSRRSFLALLGAASIVDGRSLLAALPEQGSSAPPSPAVVRGNVRFQILSPTLMRMEYAPNEQFIDAPSVSVLNRSWPKCPFESHDADDWVEIATGQMRLKYKLDSGRFAPGNLAMTWRDADGEHTWKPGDADDKNLGGVQGSFDQWRTLPFTPGPLSRNGYFRLDDSGTAVWNSATQWPEPRPNRDQAQDWYFFSYGRDYKGLLRELAQLLGPIPMVPRYIFGTWFGERAALSSDEWQRILSRFREEEIPLDLFVHDSDSTAVEVYSGFSWDPEQMPDPAAYFAWLKARGVKASVNEHYAPIDSHSDVHFDQVRKALGLPEGTKEITLDLADKKSAHLYMDVLHKPALDMGMAFWWQDGNAHSSMPGLEGTFWTRHIEYEGQERITGKRTFVFCRLRCTGDTADPSIPVQWGAHRYGGYFTGDILTGWSTVSAFVPLNVRSGNILVPFVGSCIGGVCQETESEEFYQRALQLAAFAPIFWWHGSWGMRLPWEYGVEGDAAAKQFLTLRYQLLPYIYTYARLAHETGAPLVRATYLEYPQQEPAYTFTMQYLFGQELLVAPITEPGQGQPVCKEIYLPSGEHWFDYFTGRIYPGDQVISYECPLNRIPLFVKAGAILPMAPPMDSTDQRPVDPLILDVYAGAPATFRLYEDDGLSLDYRRQAYAWTPISYAPATTSEQHRITVGPTEGRYQGQLQARRYRIQVHGLRRPARVLVNGRLCPEQQRGVMAEGWLWRQSEEVTEINLITPVTIREAVTVTLEQAGAFPDVIAVQAVQAYRARLREVKIVEKMRWAMLLNGLDINKQPHVLQITERVEQQLDDLIASPTGLAISEPDLRGMTEAILSAFLTQPFDSTRRLPDFDNKAAAMKAVQDGKFTPDELHRMTARLLDCQLIADARENATNYALVSGPIVHARFQYDQACIAPPQLEYDLRFPDDSPPGWAEIKRETDPNGTVTFTVRAPFPAVPGPHTLKLRVTATWGAHQTVLERDLVWTVSANPDRT